jgi:hypothetical protein
MSQNANLTSPNLLKHPADFANLFRSVLSPLILSLPIYFGGEGGQALIVGFTVWFLLSDMNFLLHQHVHLPLTTSTASWRIHHVDRHHAADDSWSQLFEWESSQFSYLAYVTYSLRYGVAMLVLPLIESARNAMSSKRVRDITGSRVL